MASQFDKCSASSSSKPSSHSSKAKRLMALTHFQQAKGLTAQLREIILKTFEQSLEEAPRISCRAGSGPARDYANELATTDRTPPPRNFFRTPLVR